MENDNYKVPKLEGTLSDDINQDFRKVINVLNSSFLASKNETINELKKMHNVLYIYRSICNDLFINKKNDQKIKSLLALNQHLLICALIFVLKNDDYTAYFLLRGSLESSIKIVQYGYGSNPTNSFSNNLEQVTKKIKDDFIPSTISVQQKRFIKSQINNFTQYGRKSLYGSLSDKIHIREDINVAPSIYLNNFFKTTSLMNQQLSSLFITTIEYETVFTMLNAEALKLNRISYSKIEYFRSEYTNFEYLIKTVMKLL
ncbi:hypothetical protein [Limosilactobacillus ingluviei]|uniref:hypothetical protein n=1 Tax=Limosilactobacillus ingluviei TaxID=148604 RepID=UPI0002F33503|nr:hypothetical protein [Limosilactobacillus ingluviei]